MNSQAQQTLRATLFTILLLTVLPALAAERVSDVLPPEKVPFNYPAPPREGAPGCFPIAENGQARCVIVRPAAASRRLQGMVATFQTYLALASGARFTVIADNALVPADMAAIHVGDTYPVLSSIPVAAKPGEWREFSADIVMPPQARLLSLRLFVNGQAAGARCWIDDAFIGAYPK
jgi:hypothetical protein